MKLGIHTGTISSGIGHVAEDCVGSGIAYDASTGGSGVSDSKNAEPDEGMSKVQRSFLYLLLGSPGMERRLIWTGNNILS